ncbi:MAG: CCA tRNA nucleotidyltransferase [Candidatus Omnitrophica bacterium]|nr:CCA tRNA nucleotidyltransferase [Candidatus Omnitrophota bacterium]
MSARRLQVAAPTVSIPPALRPMLERISRLAGREGVPAYAVGGCVRDWLWGVATVDVDVTVEGDGIAFARRLAASLGAGVVSHAQFGTATVKLSGARLRLDVASCRKETYAAPAAYPRVSPGTLRDDLFRRDFTINAMAMGLAAGRFGALIDPFGGLPDLRAKRLRVLHAKSFLDDPSRILRAARFAQRYRLALEPGTRAWMRQALAAGMLGRVNRGRLQKELLRMLDEPDPIACLAQVGRWVKGR